ncbi:MAG: hypothetical protein J0L93_07635 [Deltaproteobacteria bacterium]|nr:hypothetical protein [Deltaproteobacteria bacterium]
MGIRDLVFAKVVILGVVVFSNEAAAEELSNVPDADSLRTYLFNVFDKNVAEAPVQLKTYEHYFSQSFGTKRFWSDKKISFGYAKNADGDVILVTWLNDKAEAPISLVDAKEIFLDGLFAQIKSEQQLTEWQGIRRDVAGALMNLRMGEAKAEFPDGHTLKANERLEKQSVGYQPSVVMIEETNSKSLLSASRNTD